MATTQVEQDNAALIRRGFDAFNSGNMTALTELFAPDATWHNPASGVIAPEHIGRDTIFAMFAQLATETSGTFRAIPNAVAASGDRVFVQELMTGQRKGRSLAIDAVVMFTLANGKVTNVRFYLCDVEESDDFWS